MRSEKNIKSQQYGLLVSVILVALLCLPAAIVQSGQNPPGCWPQEYQVLRSDSSGVLSLSTPYYTVQHDPSKGGTITKITYKYGQAKNLLVSPMVTSVQNGRGDIFRDINNHNVQISYRKKGKTVIVTVTCPLQNEQGRDAGIALKTTYEYRWGYIKIRKIFLFPVQAILCREVNVLSMTLDASLQDYGYRDGRTEREGAAPFTYGIAKWGKIQPGTPTGTPLETKYIPRYLVVAHQGIEGIEWFESSDLSQWDLQLSGKAGAGLCRIKPSSAPLGISVSVSPLHLVGRSQPLQGTYTFDYYIGMPILEGHANKPWLHASFNRYRGNWVSETKIKQWAQSGIISVHCHNDGDYYNDGLFWRDGSYPPYPPEDMKKFDRVIETCRRYGIKTATYFSNKELHPSTNAYKQHGTEWGRKDIHGNLRTNYFRAKSPFGVQMCLKSGWLNFLKFSIDRVLKHHKLDGVYYDWNVGLDCSNPLHVKATHNMPPGRQNSSLAPAQADHWDIDELIDLMEWTRQRVGPNGMIIIHNTRVPMFVTENFANYIVSMEWGYKKWLNSAPRLQDLPLEWAFAGARSRGIIGYGIIDPKAPRRMHKILAIYGMLTGVTPWTATPEAIEIFKKLKPLGAIEQYKFTDWRNRVVVLVPSNKDCASAVYSRKEEAYIILANTNQQSRKVTCKLIPGNLPCPLPAAGSATLLSDKQTSNLDMRKLAGEGEIITIPGDSIILLHLRDTKHD